MNATFAAVVVVLSLLWSRHGLVGVGWAWFTGNATATLIGVVFLLGPRHARTRRRARTVRIRKLPRVATSASVIPAIPATTNGQHAADHEPLDSELAAPAP
jgi:hypothetical protein